MRWLGYINDPTAGGTALDAIIADPAKMLAATDFVPVETAQVDPGESTLSRDNDVRGRRANGAPIGFAAQPTWTFTSKAWTKLARTVLRKAMGGAITSTGVAPAAIQSTIQMLQSGNLPALIATLVREDQVDRLAGAWIDTVTLNFPADGEGTIEAAGQALYHDVDDASSIGGLPNPQGMPLYADAYMLRDVTAYLGAGAGVAIDCLGGFGLTLNNNLSTDFRTRFCAGKNILEMTIDSVLHRLWYPNRSKLGAQAVTGRLDFGDTRPDREARRLVHHAEKLVVDIAGPPLPGVTPAADDMMRLVLYKQAPTGGGAEPLQREGDQQSSYEFGAYLDDGTGKDLEAVFVSAAAVA